jgi:hypothetical protein
MKKLLKGRRLNKKGEFKKGQIPYFKGKNSRKKQIDKHHIDLDKNNNYPNNLLFLLNSAHNSLHKRAYDYLVQIKQVNNYIHWFLRTFKPKIYKGYKNVK